MASPNLPLATAWRFAPLAMLLVAVVVTLLTRPLLRAADAPGEIPVVRIINLVGKVELQHEDGDWQPARVMQTLTVGDRLRTQERSRADLRWSKLDIIRVPAATTLTVEAPADGSENPTVNLGGGVLYFYGREKPGSTSFSTPVVSGAIRGTEFILRVDADGATRLSLLDGEVELKNPAGALSLRSGEQAEVVSGTAPVKAPMLNVAARVQWFLYYPGVLVPEELALTEQDRTLLANSLAAYRAGNLRAAANALPATADSEGARIYSAGVLLANGSSEEADALLKTTPVGHPVATALRRLIGIVQGGPATTAATNTTATEWLVASYAHAAKAELIAALADARESTRLAPKSGYAWARVAELEFGRGHIEAAKAAADLATAASPDNAQAEALRGFLAGANGKLSEARAHFDRAIALDGSLGNAWLGRGLISVRENQVESGRSDLQMAAALEPRRSLLRSYLGKSFSQNGRADLAFREFELARVLDPGDPTPRLYAALLEQQENRINEAARDLRASQALNDNRGVFRSRLLLDQDYAVRSANLASIYHDAGLADFGERQAAQAVQRDYGNSSAHLFLANSYQEQQRDQGVNLRLETPAVTEYLLASLLAPVGQNNLSRLVSEQEYGRFFTHDGLGVADRTDYRSNGSWEQSFSLFGTYQRASFATDVTYARDAGERANQDLSQLGFTTQFKMQLGPQDDLLLYASWNEAQSGDRAQYYQPALADTKVRVSERQKPNLLVGYHRQWTPGQDTLLLAGRFQDDYRVTDPEQAVPLFVAGPTGLTPLPTGAPFAPLVTDFSYRNRFTLYSTELQHIAKFHDHEVIAGARYQQGDFETGSELVNTTPPGLLALFFPGGFNSAQQLDESLHRLSLYLYDTWELTHGLWLVGGVNYSRLQYPANFRNSPLHAGHLERSEVSPKAGLIWQPRTNTLVRAQYSQSLGGASFDQSVSLEPTLVAGLNQSYRSIIPESVIGAASAPQNEVAGVALEQVWPTATFMICQAEWLRSRVDQDFGGYTVSLGAPPNAPVTLSQQSRYDEHTLRVTLGQMVGPCLTLGTSYRLSQARLNNSIPALDPATPGYASHPEALLHQLGLFAVVNHPSGFFGRAESWWYHQHNSGYATALPGDDFWQLNFRVGMRFWHRRAEASVALLNATGQDYRLNPLNTFQELPRSRMVATSLRFVF